IVKLIKASRDVDAARAGLMKKFKLSEIQAKAILDMRLQRLTGLERKKIEDEYRDTIKQIERLRAILKSKQLQMEIIREELLEIRKNYGDERRTEIVYTAEEFSIEDMIAEEQVVITISHGGFIKRYPVSGYRRQSRGGRGSTGATTKEDDFIEHMFVASTHDYIMLFTDVGRCYWLKVFEIPEGGRASRGKSIANLISKEQAETIASYVSVKNFEDPLFVMMVTEQGMIKKTPLAEFANPRRTGIGAIGLGKGDRLIDVRLTDGSQDVVIGTHEGLAIRFHEQEARPMGRSAGGVRAIRLEKKDRVIGAVALRRSGTTILVVTEKGFGKRSETDEYRVSHRGGKGIFTVKTTEKTGRMVSIREVVASDDVVVVTSGGIVIRQHASEIRVAGRNTQGVRLIKLGEGDSVSDVASVMAEDQEIPGDGGKQGGEEEGATSAEEKKNLKPRTPETGKAAPSKATPPGKAPASAPKKTATTPPGKAPASASKRTAAPKKTRKPPPRRTAPARGRAGKKKK
ncbi:MAG TPA: DNA gyrase C-terminal beta-propeller domain-containing protein, partial [Bacteroidota bacterium]|nr:DNA gyrase C-terminal beta-propeller domain-containing protein [Bacteroidota bacterium]